MLFKKKDKESKPKKEKKVPVMKVGTHKKTVIALWLVLIASISFGVYKNFTAIDMHTVHEKAFNVLGMEVQVSDDQLSKALKCLPERKRNIILLSYFMDMSDAEIGELMNVVRTTVYRHRTSTLEELRKMMEELPV